MEQKIVASLSQETLTLADAQLQIDQWIKTVGVRYFNELTNMGILVEEVGELSRLMVRIYGEQSFKQSDLQKANSSVTALDAEEAAALSKAGQLHPSAAKAALGDEMADVLWVLCCLANQTGINLTEAVQRNFEKKNIRDQNRHKENPKLG